MRDYVSGNWGFTMIWGLTGSVFPRAFAMAVPNAILAFIFAQVAYGGAIPDDVRQDRADNAIKMLAAFTSVQFFVLFFRSNVAYSRWWEGGTLLQKTRGEWFNAYSSLIAFCSTDPDMAPKVEEFQHLLARLMSMLFCAGLQQVSPNKTKTFEVIDTKGIDPKSLEFLGEAQDKVEVLLQWIQRSTVLNSATGVLPIAPPILSRAFQEISRGIVNLQNARKIADFPFPFPYAQMSMVMLMLHYCISPVLAGMLLEPVIAALASFLMVFFLWCINFIALQLEYPFGERTNDLPMIQFQRDWNKSVATLLARRANQPPSFTFDAEFHRQMGLIMSDGTQSKKERVTVIGNVRNSQLFAGTNSVRSTKDYNSNRGSFFSRGAESLYNSLFSSNVLSKTASGKSVTSSMDPEVLNEGASSLRGLQPVREVKTGEYFGNGEASLESGSIEAMSSAGSSPVQLGSQSALRHYDRSASSNDPRSSQNKSALKQPNSPNGATTVSSESARQNSPLQLETVALPELLYLDDTQERDRSASPNTADVRRLAILRASTSDRDRSRPRAAVATDRREVDRIPREAKNEMRLSM